MSNDIFPYAYIPDPKKGNPIANGYMYFGEADKDPENFPIAVQGRQEDGTLISLTQPIRTDAGGVPTYNGFNIVLVVSVDLYSIKILNSHLVQVYYQAESSGNVSPVDVSKVFDTVADMVADPGLFVGQKCRTLGYYAIGDGGGNDYNIVSAGTGTDDGGSYIDLATLQAKGLFDSNIANVSQFGAKGDDSTDNTTQMQAFLDYVSDTVLGLIPEGTFISGQVDVRTKSTIIGIGASSIVKLKTGGAITDVLFRVFGNQSDPSLPSNNSLDVTIQNLKLLGTVSTDAFSEFRHLCMCQGVTNFKLLDCVIEGFQGDGLVVRSGNATAQAENYDVTVKGCTFDGVNNDNRNAMSITDCTNMVIEGNSFRRCTRSNMPGAIDIEPNATDTYVKLNGIVIRDNFFKDIGGDVGVISFLTSTDSAAYDQHPQNFTITGNTIENCVTGISLRHIQASANRVPGDIRINMVVSDNHVKDCSLYPFWIYGLNGVSVLNNTFTDCEQPGRIGWSDTFRGCSNIDFVGNTLTRCGRASGYGVITYQSNFIKFRRNTFIDCGVDTGGFGIAMYFATGANTSISIVDNFFITALGWTTAAIGVDAASTLALDKQLVSNDFNGLTASSARISFNDQLYDVRASGGTISERDNLKQFILDNAAGYTITLPLPYAGAVYRFTVRTPPTGGAYRIAANGASAIIYGTINVTLGTSGGTVQGVNVKTFAVSAALQGDWMEFVSDGVNWYVNGSTQATGGIG